MSGLLAVSRRLRRGAMLALPGALVLALSGCETGPKSGRIAYDCERGSGLIVSFEGDRARLFAGGGPPIHLQHRRSLTGFWYESPTHSIRGQGRRLDFMVGRMLPIRCFARGSNPS